MPIESLDPANSVLFLGSGFSAGAINISKAILPAGYPLLERLADVLGEEVNDLDLKSAADEFLIRTELSLYELLYNTFTVTNVLPYQRDIILLPWARIYTTNYDDVISQVKGAEFPLFTFDDPRPRRLPQAFAVHLHGSIRRANEENSESQLILNSKSYDSITRQHQHWFHEFQRDRRTFAACYFMGFSLNDHHISGLMASGEESVRRTCFVSRCDPKASFVRRVSEYGEILPIGFEAFAELAKKLPKPELPRDLSALQSFKYLRPGLDSKALAPPTPVEIINLVSFGTFSQSRFFNTPVDHPYVASRSKDVEGVISALEDAKTILIHSRLGNGKTIFISLLAQRAANEGFVCLLWRRAGRQLAQDLEIISENKRVIVIFDDYDAAIDNIERIAAGAPSAKFVVTVRSGQQEVRFHEIVQRLPPTVRRVSLNTFSEDDRAQLLAILRRAGAQTDGLEQTVRSARDIRDIVTQLYNHTQIRDKIHAAVETTSAIVNRIIVLASLIKWAGVEIEDNYIQDIVERDIYIELRKNEVFSGDILNIDDDRVEMRSSMLSEYFIQRIFAPEKILDGCYDITTTSMRRKTDRAHRRLAGELMKLSSLQRFLKFQPGSTDAINRYYVRLSNDKDVNAEPLFWLQYAILMKTSGDIANARMFLNAGYDRASKIEGFKTFQLDTQALSIFLQEEIESDSVTVEGFDNIIKSINMVADMIFEKSNRYYAIEVIGEIPAFVDARHRAMTIPEKNLLIFELNRVCKALLALTADEKASLGSEFVRLKIEGSVTSIIR